MSMSNRGSLLPRSLPAAQSRRHGFRRAVHRVFPKKQRLLAGLGLRSHDCCLTARGEPFRCTRTEPAACMRVAGIFTNPFGSVCRTDLCAGRLPHWPAPFFHEVNHELH